MSTNRSHDDSSEVSRQPGKACLTSINNHKTGVVLPEKFCLTSYMRNIVPTTKILFPRTVQSYSYSSPEHFNALYILHENFVFNNSLSCLYSRLSPLFDQCRVSVLLAVCDWSCQQAVRGIGDQLGWVLDSTLRDLWLIEKRFVMWYKFSSIRWKIWKRLNGHFL